MCPASWDQEVIVTVRGPGGGCRDAVAGPDPLWTAAGEDRCMETPGGLSGLKVRDTGSASPWEASKKYAGHTYGIRSHIHIREEMV